MNIVDLNRAVGTDAIPAEVSAHAQGTREL